MDKFPLLRDKVKVKRQHLRALRGKNASNCPRMLEFLFKFQAEDSARRVWPHVPGAIRQEGKV
jgi:hypothetical protein